MSSKYNWILDFGHGGIDLDGNYTTKGKKQYHFTDDSGKVILTVYEGEVNRKIGDKLVEMLKRSEISYKVVSHPIKDTPLRERVNDANTHYLNSKGKGIFVSIHSNAASIEIQGKGSKAHGYEIYTSVGQTSSDKVADVFLDAYKKVLGNTVRMRADNTDGDGDKEAQFYVLRKTIGPAILVENLFYDNYMEAKYLLSEAGQDAISKALFKGIQDYESKY